MKSSKSSAVYSRGVHGKKKIVFLGVLLTVALSLAACTLDSSDLLTDDSGFPTSTAGHASSASDPLTEIFIIDKGNVQTTPDGTKFLVPPSKIRGGGPPKDGIPSIDSPEFVTVAEADQWIQDNELVLALIHNGVKRVYPLQILVWHEIVNDNLAGDPMLVTYCPLCGSGIAYEPTINVSGELRTVQFGTSGKLFNSNLVMYDRETNTYWSQIDGIAILGELTGQELREVSIDTVVWREWKLEHPDSEVLSQNTGFNRQYGRDPYGSYYEDSNLFFPVEAQDTSVHPKDVIFGIEALGEHRAYREKDLIAAGGEITDVVNSVRVRITRDSAGVVTVMNVDSGKEMVKERDFWFAWYAFHPHTTLFEP